MRTEIAELTLRIARTILENAKAGRVYDPLVVEWARQIVDGNAAPALPRVWLHQSRVGMQS